MPENCDTQSNGYSVTPFYNGSTWDAAFDEFYATHTDGYGNLDGLIHTLKGKTSGYLNCLYEGTNDISQYYVDDYGYDYTFYYPTSEESGDPITPLTCFARVKYTFDGTTIKATIKDWQMMTMIQVAVTDLDKNNASQYSLSCDNMYNMSSLYINSESGEAYAIGGDDTNIPAAGVINDDGVAFCFYDVWDAEDPFVFTLYKNGVQIGGQYTVKDKYLETSSEAVKFIKINKESFGL